MTTVAQLIEILKGCNPNAIVNVRNEHGVLTHRIEVSTYADSCYNPPKRVVRIDEKLDPILSQLLEGTK